MESVSEILLIKLDILGLVFSSIGFNLVKNLKSDEAIYINISKNKSTSNKLYSPIAPGKNRRNIN